MENQFLLFIVIMIFGSSACTNNRNVKEATIPDLPLAFSPVYVGTYTKKEAHVNGKADGIYLLHKNNENGHLEMKSTVAKVVNPSFLTISPDRRNLYAVSEVADGLSGFIYAFEIKNDNSLILLHKLSTDSPSPCHVSLDNKGQYVFVANYMGGVVKMYKRMDDGRLSPSDQINLEGSGTHPEQGGPHAHTVKVSPDDRFAFIADKGSDKIWIFKIDTAEGKLLPNEQHFMQLQDGAGPRHFTFHPNGKYAYVINELDNTINAYSYDSSVGGLSELQSISTLPGNFEGPSFCADIHVHPNGKFLYGSNRGHDSIAIFKIDENSGKLDLIDHVSTQGNFPRNFAIDATGSYLYVANQNSDNIVLFNIDKDNGSLIFSDHILDIKTPVCINLGSNSF